jgi:hypothetical protein
MIALLGLKHKAKEQKTDYKIEALEKEIERLKNKR